MDANYGSRAIYSNPSTKLLPYILLLVAAKSLKAFGLYLTYDLLKVINVVQFLFIVKTGASALLILLQKPIGNGPKLSKNQWFKVARLALCETCVHLLWLFGFTLCGPLRSILLYEHSDIVLIAALTAIFTSSSGGTAKARGAAFFVIAILGILFFDHDDFDQHKEDYHPEGRHSGIISHTFYHFVSLSGLSDHKGGVVLLCATLCLQVGYNSSAKIFSVTIGGAKRLHALTTLVSAILLAPWAGFIYWTSPEQVTSMSWTDLAIQLGLVILLVFVLDYYVVSVSMSRMDAPKTSTIGFFVLMVAGLLLSVFWNHHYMQRLKKGALKEDHVLSGGVIFSCVLFMFATRILSSPNKGNRGTFIGYSAAGLPLYQVSSDFLHSTTSSAMSVIHGGLRQILEERESRQIFYFLCINLVFTFVELVYGAWTNSLGLISDGFHMLFDCSALVMGLYAAIMSRWKATRIFSYGYDRVEILSGFINGLFLVVIAFFVFTAAISRIFDPPTIHTERLLVVSVLGLLVNLIGIFAFSHGHSHGGMSHGHSHDVESHSHNHNHAEAHGNSHGHSHDSHSHKTQEHRSSNMQGVFLHVLADTLGSVGVIISTLLIENFGWNISDPICSIFISTLIFLSVLPLLKETSAVLLLRSPVQLETDIAKIFTKFVSMDEILSLQNYKFWQHSSKTNCGSIHLQVAPSASEQKVTAKMTACFKEIGINNITLQVEKEPYFQHMSGLQASNIQPVFNRKYSTKSGSEDTVKVV